MSMRKTHLCLFAAALFAASCTEDVENVFQTNYVEAQISGTVSEMTRATGTVWEANDAIGIFVKKPSAEGVFQYANIAYHTPDASGSFQSVSEKIYYPADGDAVNFMAYYPYSSDNVSEGKYQFNLTADVPLSQKDVMYAAVNEHTQNDGNVPFNFKHMLSKIVVNLKSDSHSLLDATVSINNQCNAGVLNLLSGTVSATEQATYDNVLFFEGKGNGEYHVIVMPSSENTGCDITMQLDGQSYVAHLDPTYSYASGYKHSFTITLKGLDTDPENVEIVIEKDITEWTDGREESLEADVNVPDVTGKRENVLLTEAVDLSMDTPVQISQEQLAGLSVGDVICFYYKKEVSAQAKIYVNKEIATRAVNSYEYTLTAGTTAGRIGITISDDDALVFFANGIAITGENVKLSCLSAYSNTLGDDSGDNSGDNGGDGDGNNGDGDAPSDATTDPITANTIMVIDFEPTEGHNAGWDNSWTNGEATQSGEENGNTYMRLVSPMVDGWIFNCSHIPVQTISDIENYEVKFDVRIDEGVTGASDATIQFVLADNWIWAGTGVLPETTDGKWVTVSRKIADLKADLTGELVFVKEDGGVQGSGLSGENVPAGISFDNLRLDPIQ